jgi:hypothetical protein
MWFTLRRKLALLDVKGDGSGVAEDCFTPPMTARVRYPQRSFSCRFENAMGYVVQKTHSTTHFESGYNTGCDT